MEFIKQGKSSLKENEFGVQDTLSHGILNVKSHLKESHPLEFQEKNYDELEEKNVFSQLRVNQGLYAPFKFGIEREFAKKVNRLPCLKSSNLMLSVLKGTDETIEIEDVLNNQREFGEYNRDPHVSFNTKQS